MDVSWDRLDARSWAAALPPEACALQQHWRFGAAVQAAGGTVRRAELRDETGSRGLAQVMLRRAGPLRLALVSRGPVWGGTARDPAAGARALRRALAGAGTLLFVTPEAGRAGLPLMTPATMAELPLRPDPAAMRARMAGKWRNRLNRAEAGELRVVVTVPDRATLDRLCARDAAQGRARGYRGLPRAFLAAWAAQPGAPMRLFTALRAGPDPGGAGAVAQMLFLDHPPGATYQIGWTDAAGRAAGAHHLLLWHAMRHFAGRGRVRLDLGMLDTEGAPGLARFKLGSGAAVRTLGATALVLPRLPGGGGPARPRGTRSGRAQALSFSRSAAGSLAGSTGGTLPPG